MGNKIKTLVVIVLVVVIALVIGYINRKSNMQQTANTNQSGAQPATSSTPVVNNKPVVSDNSGAPIAFNSPVVAQSSFANGKDVAVYSFYAQIQSLQQVGSGTQVTLMSSEKNLPVFTLDKNTKIWKTALKGATPASLTDLKPQLYITLATYYVIPSKKWGPVSDVFINTEYQGPGLRQ